MQAIHALALPPVPPAPPSRHQPVCAVCGCAEVEVDCVEDAVRAFTLELGECPRCDHRWTRPVSGRPETRSATVRALREPDAEAVPNAA